MFKCIVFFVIFCNTIFPLIRASNAYLILRLCCVVDFRGWRLKEGGAYFKVSGIIRIKFQIRNFLCQNKKNDSH